MTPPNSPSSATPLSALPWGLLDGLQRLATRLQPPVWLEREAHNRVLLLLNHVLMQEPQAMQRLARHAGKSIRLHVAPVEAVVRITPPGLLELSTAGPKAPDLGIELKSPAWSHAAKAVAQGGQPDLHIFGDVMLAAEIGWLREHVRWEIEEDLARLLGDGPAVALLGAARRFLDALRRFAGLRTAGTGTTP
jgi:ubiquinone biosynthesis accessory factor UbiJ